jgi:hypothetical protein
VIECRITDAINDERLGSPPYATRELLPQEMLAPYAEIYDRVSEIFVRWFAMEQQVRDCLDLYFATISGGHLYSHQTFLFLPQAIEVYHRLNMNFVNQVQSKVEFKRRKIGFQSPFLTKGIGSMKSLHMRTRRRWRSGLTNRLAVIAMKSASLFRTRKNLRRWLRIPGITSVIIRPAKNGWRRLPRART